MIPVIVKWVDGPPEKFKPGQFVVYEDGECELVGWGWESDRHSGIIKHTTLIEPHELDWLKSMAAGRSLGVAK